MTLSRNLLQIVLPTLIGMFLLKLLDQIDISPEPPLDLSMSTYPGSTVVSRNNGGDANFAKYLSDYVSEKGGSFVNAEDSQIEKS